MTSKDAIEATSYDQEDVINDDQSFIRPGNVDYGQRFQGNSVDVKRCTNVDLNGNVQQRPCSSTQNKTFKGLVRKHFLRDRVFYLVHDLLSTIENERKARNELIESFREARLMKIVQPYSHSDKTFNAIIKPKRQRKQSHIPLLERISYARRNSISLSKDTEETREYNKKATSEDISDSIRDLKLTTGPSKDEVNGDISLPDRLTQTEGNDVGLIESGDIHSDKSVVGGQRGIENKVKHSNPTATEQQHETVARDKDCSSKSNRYIIKGNINELNSVNNPRDIQSGNHTACLLEEQKVPFLIENEIDPVRNETRQSSVSPVIPTTDNRMSELTTHERISKERETNMDALESVYDANNHQDESEHPDVKRSQRNKQQATSNTGNTEPDSTRPDSQNEIVSEQTVRVEVESDTDSSDLDNDSSFRSILKVKIVGSDGEEKNSDSNTGDTSDQDDDVCAELNVPSSSSQYGRITPYMHTKQTASLQPKLDSIAETSHESFSALTNSPRNDTRSVIEIQSKERRYSTNGHGQRRDISPYLASFSPCRNGKGKSFAPGKQHYKGQGQEPENVAQTRKDARIDRISRKSTRPNTCGVSRRNARSPESKMQRTIKSKSAGTGRPGLITIDLLGVYENNKDLHIVKRPRKKKQPIMKKNITECERHGENPTPSNQRKKRRLCKNRKYDMTPLPPKITSYNLPPQIGFGVVLAKTASSSETSSTSDTTGSCELVRLYTKEGRYKKPDRVILDHLDIHPSSQGKVFDKQKGRHGKHFALNGRVSTNDGGDKNSTNDGVAYIPLKEAIKTVRSAKTVPDLPTLSDTIPRRERVGRLYIDLKKERKGLPCEQYQVFRRKQERNIYDDEW